MGQLDATEVNAMESEAWFRTLLESAPDAMIIVNEAGEIATVNNQAVKLFGYDRSELRGQKIEMLIPADVRSRHEAHRENYAVNPKVRAMGAGLDLMAQKKNGDVFPVEISLSPVEIDSVRFVSSVIRDVTQRKQLERDLIAANRRRNVPTRRIVPSSLPRATICDNRSRH